MTSVVSLTIVLLTGATSTLVWLAYHVISMWFLKCRLSFRKDFVEVHHLGELPPILWYMLLTKPDSFHSEEIIVGALKSDLDANHMILFAVPWVNM